MANIPHIKYIESLVVSKFSAEEIKRKLEDYNLDANPKVISIVMKTLRKDKPDYFDPTDPEPAEPEWISDELDVAEMFSHFTNFSLEEKTKPVEGAFQLLNDPMMYRLITSMAIALMDDQDIDLIVNGKFNMEYGASDIKMFLKYFFNLNGWTLKDRQQYVNQVEDPQLAKYYKIALKKDKNYLLWKLGAAPEQDFGVMMKDMLNDSYYNFKEQSNTQPEQAQKWGRLAIKITDRIDSYDKEKKGKGAENFMENFEFNIKTEGSMVDGDGKKEANDIKHISELQDNHPAMQDDEEELEDE